MCQHGFSHGWLRHREPLSWRKENYSRAPVCISSLIDVQRLKIRLRFSKDQIVVERICSKVFDKNVRFEMGLQRLKREPERASLKRDLTVACLKLKGKMPVNRKHLIMAEISEILLLKNKWKCSLKGCWMIFKVPQWVPGLRFHWSELVLEMSRSQHQALSILCYLAAKTPIFC